MKYDLHIHSKYSQNCGFMDLKKIIKIAKKKRLDGIAITDHNTIKGAYEAKKYETKEFKIIIGCEVSTKLGEITGLFLTEEIKSRELEDVILEIQEQDGIVVIPHPFDKLRSSSFGITDSYANYVDAIEVFNSRCMDNKYNIVAQKFAKKHNLPAIAGSDAHFPNEIGLAGVIANEDLKNAILKNKIKWFGKRSSILNHLGTKLLKFKRGVK